MIAALVAGAMLATAPAEAAAGVDARVDAAEARCRYLQGVASSEKLLLLSPMVFASAGLVQVGSPLTGTDNIATQTAPRVSAGVELDAARFRRGIATGSLADASCELAAIEESLSRFEVSGDAVVEGPALAAREAALQAALPEAAAIVERIHDLLGRGLSTIEEVQAMELRLEKLRAAAAEAAQARAELRPAPPISLPALESQLGALTAAEQAVHGAEGEVRKSSSLSLSIRAGIDQIIDDRASGLPVFGVLTLSWFPGGLWQPAAERRAGLGLRDYSNTSVTQSADRFRAQLGALRARADVERKRLTEAKVILADLQRRHDELGKMPGERVLAFRDALYFDLVTARTEVAALEAGLAALDGFFRG